MWSCQPVLSNVQQTKHNVWERKGVVIESKEPLIEMFTGCLIARNSKQFALQDPMGGIDVGITLTVRRKSKWSTISGEEIVSTEAWNHLVERLLNSEHEGTIIESPMPTRSVVSGIQFQIPALSLWTDCTTTEERYDIFVQWIQNGLNLLIQEEMQWLMTIDQSSLATTARRDTIENLYMETS